MPSRFLREAYITSERVEAASPECRDLFVRLLLVADDYGRFHADPRIVASKCFPLSASEPDSRTSAGNCARMLAECEQAKLITLYEVDGKRYLQINQWSERVRSKPKFPDPPENAGQLPDSCQQLADNCQPPSSYALRLTPSPTPSPSAASRISFDDDHGWTGITERDKTQWAEAFPAVAISVELAGAREWVKANPANRKSNWRRFLTGWFKRAQDRAPPVRMAGSSGKKQVAM